MMMAKETLSRVDDHSTDASRAKFFVIILLFSPISLLGNSSHFSPNDLWFWSFTFFFLSFSTCCGNGKHQQLPQAALHSAPYTVQHHHVVEPKRTNAWASAVACTFRERRTSSRTWRAAKRPRRRVREDRKKMWSFAVASDACLCS